MLQEVRKQKHCIFFGDQYLKDDLVCTLKQMHHDGCTK
jgi:hypothetical protein